MLTRKLSAASDAPSPPAIELHRVGVSRGGRWILRDVDWTVAPRTCAAILGPNGSGKSTLARVISGYIWPSSGEVAVDGHRFGDVDINELRKTIRLVQPAGPYDVDGELTVREVVLTGAFGTIGLFNEPTADDVHRADQLIDRVGLPQVRHRPYVTLSSGERVRSLIARALMHRPKLLILDEPTAGLDLLAREQVLATVQSLLNDPRHAPTVLMITHHVEELPPATGNVLLLDEGRVAAQGTPAEVLRTDVLSHVYHCPLNVINRSGRYYVQVDPSAWGALLG